MVSGLDTKDKIDSQNPVPQLLSNFPRSRPCHWASLRLDQVGRAINCRRARFDFCRAFKDDVLCLGDIACTDDIAFSDDIAFRDEASVVTVGS